MILLSFSGIDGAGKTTQITALQRCLAEGGSRVLLLSFWEDIAVLTRIREAMSHGLLGGETGVGSPDKPVNRRDKNVKSWYMTLARLFFYSLDTIRLNLIVAKVLRNQADVVVFDRYIYDEFANLVSCGWLARAYMRLLLRCSPKPDIAYLLDADPQVARERKPEYPVEFIRKNRESYLVLSELAGMAVLGPLPALETSQKIMEEIQKRRSGTSSAYFESLTPRHACACDENVRAGAER